jgi:phosphoribosylamine--glycine ligase
MDGGGIRVVVVGGGAREHALAWALAQDPDVASVTAVPGNAGMERDGTARCRPDLSWDQLPDWAAREADLVVVGPEAPLADGLADRLRAHGVRVVGPGQDGARIESSKVWAKELMGEMGIPTARALAVRTMSDVHRALDALHGDVVVKADGLASGKGVFVPSSRDDAIGVVQRLLEGRLGEAGRLVLVEERLSGPELSAMVLTDGVRFHWLPPSMDYKRLNANASAPNTGGMGALAPHPLWTPALADDVSQRMVQPLLEGLRRHGIRYRGVLYAGLMLTANGPAVLEWNCRLGDPEATAVLPLVMRGGGYLAAHLLGAAEGRLPDGPLEARGAAVAVVMAASGYPDAPVTGGMLEVPESISDGLVFHAGTTRDGMGFRNTGGRTLSVVGLGDDVETARRRAYDGVRAVRFPASLVRDDIGVMDSHS